MVHKNAISKSPWFKDGLRFKCNQCGRCCRGKPGVVLVNEKDIQNIADHLRMPIEKFSKTFIRKVYGRYSLTEFKTGDCVMYKNGCSIYPVRPYQCKAFPFWLSNIETEEAWDSLKELCPGIDCDKLYTCKEIANIVLEGDTKVITALGVK
ncbi:MAG: YkgJ family cysteine cluster protein [Candidatus Anammoxibacter sp.]